MNADSFRYRPHKLAETALAILALTAFDEYGAVRAWKGSNWDLLDALHQRGWIADPRGKAKSVILTEEEVRLADEFLQQHFGLPAENAQTPS